MSENRAVSLVHLGVSLLTVVGVACAAITSQVVL